VYVGALTRICFLLGIGVRDDKLEIGKENQDDRKVVMMRKVQ